MRRVFFICSFVMLVGLGLMPAQGSRVTPMALEMTPTGRGSQARIEVANTDGRDIAMEIRMYRGRIAENGELELEPADDRFAAFPSQVVVPPEGRQIFRIQFIPSGPMTKSEIYYASISQLPVDLEETGSRIQMLMRFNVLVNVVPEGTTAKPEIQSARWVEREVPAAPDAPKDAAPMREQGVEVRVVNNGTRYFPAGRIGWEVSGADEAGARVTESFAANAVSEQIGMGVVAPGKARVFFLPMKRQLRDPSVTLKR